MPKSTVEYSGILQWKKKLRPCFTENTTNDTEQDGEVNSSESEGSSEGNEENDSFYDSELLHHSLLEVHDFLFVIRIKDFDGFKLLPKLKSERLQRGKRCFD